MPWLMTSRRHRGFVGSPPYVEFAIGTVKIAEIVMNKPTNQPWAFTLRLPGWGRQNVVFEAFEDTAHHTFSEALTELHRLLNHPPPEDFTYAIKGPTSTSSAQP